MSNRDLGIVLCVVLIVFAFMCGGYVGSKNSEAQCTKFVYGLK